MIAAVNGASPDLYGRGFLVWFRLNRSVGDTIRLKVLEGDRRREIEYELTR